ncbi:MAG: class I SAM-dependent methyltransferase [Acidimicrobiales bacterium]
MDAVNREQRDFWQALTPGWLEAESHAELVAGRFGEAAMAQLPLRAGDRVMDIGCGSGGTTRRLGERVGPAGAVLGLDIAPAMIDAARAREIPGSEPVPEFAVSDVQVDELGAGRFDAAFCRFGVMFFADPAAAFANIRRSLKAAGTLAFTCWGDLFSNEWMFVPGAAAVSVTGEFPAMPGDGEPGPFSLADPVRVERLLDDAGFVDIQVGLRSDVVALPASRVGSMVALSTSVGPVHEALRDADESTRSSVREAVRSALEAKVIDGELRLSASAHLVTAKRP